ncbi:hypothetical protein EDD86DRAFT_206290 [Gorgonomyces haynaldii]|nr:hypothetical protein EDD86DRAFT_206290 [Gorgonomyces haynaldii]
MEKIQALSGLAFGTFGILHLGGHVLANYSFKASDAFMYAAREIYQSPLFESMLGVSLLVHMGSSAWIYSKRQPPRKLKNETGSETMKLIQKEAQVNRYCGYTIAFFVFGHIFATRLGPILYLDDPSIIDLSYVTLSYQNLPYLMLPYYFVLILILVVQYLCQFPLFVLFCEGTECVQDQTIRCQTRNMDQSLSGVDACHAFNHACHLWLL